jgi:hypothetical protein
MRLLKKHVSLVAAQTKPAAQRRTRTPLQFLSRLPSLVPISRASQLYLPRLWSLDWVQSRKRRRLSRAEIAWRIRRRSSRSSAFALSDPKSLTVGVCLFNGVPRVQLSSWINENNLPLIT